MMGFWRAPTAVGIALSERLLVAVTIPSKHERRVAARTLEPGAVEPSPSSPNIGSVRDVARLATEALEELEAPNGGTAVSVVLPDRSVTTKLFPASRRESERALRQEFRSKLVYPAVESRSDTWRGRAGEVLAAAVRLPVVRQYEQVVEATGGSLGWVDAATLATLPQWLASMRSGRGNDGALALRVLLFPAHYTVSVLRNGELVDLRTKLRVEGDANAVAEELRRVPTMHDATSVDASYISGVDAKEIADALSVEETFTAIHVSEPTEAELLASSAESLMRRN